MQKTIQRPITVEGVGLHSGQPVRVTLRPAPPDSGIRFRRVDLQNFVIEAHRRWVSRVVLATTLMKRGVMISTVEHLLSAVYGCGIDNLVVDLDALELPILDGSARPWVEALDAAGVVSQPAERSYLVVQKELRITDGDRWVSLEPAPRFAVDYTIDFPHPVIGRQHISLEITPETYRRELCWARTFGFLAEVEELRRQGLARGGSLENAVVLTETGVLNGDLRAPDEFVRHKALDLIGDVSLCGAPLLGRLRAHRAGHALHTRLAAALAENREVVMLLRESELTGVPVVAAAGR
ncbi:MAG: UDP-3-O-acyl-N-acetylglucosamine deacetylase [Acidobacteriota bacterium]